MGVRPATASAPNLCHLDRTPPPETQAPGFKPASPNHGLRWLVVLAAALQGTLGRFDDLLVTSAPAQVP